MHFKSSGPRSTGRSRWQQPPLSESQAEAAALVGVDDIERRQHVQQLTHLVLAGCKQASQPFTWIRAAGLRSVAAAISLGLEDGQALSAVLESTYSQVIEVILSALDRDLIYTQSAGAVLAAASRQGGSNHSTQVDDLLSAVGRYPAGYAPAAASSEELQEAFKVLQVLCLLHRKACSVLCKAQYLQLIIARACEAPACLPAAMNTLLTLLQGNEEAQGLFVSTGGMDMLLTRTLQHLRLDMPESSAAAAPGEHAAGGKASTARSSQDAASGDVLVDGAGLTRRELAVQLLLFLQLLLHWVIADAVKAGAHPSTQRAALTLVVNHCGPDVAAAVNQEPPAGQLHSSTAAHSKLPTPAAAGGLHSPEQLLQLRSEAAADKLLQWL